MTIPTADFRDTDLSNTGVWTQTGDPQFEPDLWSSEDVATDLDGTDSLAAANVISSGSTKMSGSIWLKRDAVASRTEVFFSQQAGFNTTGFKCLWFVGTLRIVAYDTGGNSVLSQIAESNVPLGSYFHFAWDVEALGSGAADINIRINSVEPSYTAQDSQTAAGFNSFTSTDGIDIGFATGEFRFTGQETRPVLWDNVALTSAQWTEEFANEKALQLANGIQGGAGRPNFRLDFLRQTRKNKGITRHNR